MNELNEKAFVALRADDGKWLVEQTRFKRVFGDVMLVDNKRYVVIAFGTEHDCREVMKESIKINNTAWAAGKRPVYPTNGIQERESL